MKHTKKAKPQRLESKELGVKKPKLNVVLKSCPRIVKQRGGELRGWGRMRGEMKGKTVKDFTTLLLFPPPIMALIDHVMNQSHVGVRGKGRKTKERDKNSLNLKYSNMKCPSGDDEQ